MINTTIDNKNLMLIETDIKDWSQISRLSYRFLQKFVFRGQPDYNFPLLSSFERVMNSLYPNLYDRAALPLQEREMLEMFKWKFSLYGKNPPEREDNVEWLTIMQHFGAPTRLLDITRSFYVASYFATANLEKKDTAVWALNTSYLRRHAFFNYCNLHNVKGCRHSTIDLNALKIANSLIGRDMKKEDEPFLPAISPQRANERVANQQGMFIMQSDIGRPFHEHIGKLYSKTEKIDFSELIGDTMMKKISLDDIAIIKFKIPKDITFDVRNSLYAMNINSESLFPGLEGMARSLLTEDFDLRR